AFRADGSSLGISDVLVNVVPQPRDRASTPAEAAPTTEAVPPTEQAQPTVPPTEAATEPPPATAEPPTAEPTEFPGVASSVVYLTLNVRQGPGTNYPAVATLAQNDQVTVIGRNADNTWLAIRLDGGAAWVIAESVGFEGDKSQLPLVAAP
ncbi:MAG: SH3 domain-containing protein, partial [Chloroflexi bacterium]|nr:SH3 domain-containing protein [Chloroflexota bacterium]